MRLILVALMLIMLGSSAFGQTDVPVAGAYGGACREGDSPCDQGVCDRSSNICVSCGGEGAPACIGNDGKPVCTFPGYGYRPMSLGGRQLYCFTQETTDCGHVGLPACDISGKPVCRFGIQVVAADGTAFCAACGDYGQPCCPGSACDYGACRNNVCLPEKQAGSTGQGGDAPLSPAQGNARAAILAAIAGCRLTEARAMHANADPNEPWYDEVSRDLTEAVERENEVRALYDRALARQAEARSLVGEGDHDNALLAFQAAADLLRDARALTRCDGTRDVIDEAVAINRRNAAPTRAVALVAMARADIGLCNFRVAGELLDEVPADTPGRDAVLTLLEEARNRESRVEQMFDAARNLHRLADERVRAGNPGQALEMLQDARQGLVNARQLTECRAYRDRITDALRVVGASLELAEGLANAKNAGQAPGPQLGSQTSAPANPGQPFAGRPHPCHDPSVPADGSAAFYAQYFGGGGESFIIKGNYLCDPPFIDTPFAILGGNSMTLYACTRQGDHYVDCPARETIAFTDVRPEGKGTGYFWRKEGAWRWMVVVGR